LLKNRRMIFKRSLIGESMTAKILNRTQIISTQIGGSYFD